MATIELKQVEKQFGDFHAVEPMDLRINEGEFVVLLGPSGCGKTTTLRMISGLEAVTAGNIFFDGRDVTWLHPSERDIAFVFQFFALYSHLKVQDNIAFPLQAQGMARSQIKMRVDQVAELLKIKHLLNKRPGALSGGDQQRVALARALVRRPTAFLMDEPLGALDADFREEMRAEIKRLHIDQNATSVYVTHDQIEAMAMGDRIVVMSNAVIQQVGTPREVHYDPANLFVARFIGSPGMNLIEGNYQDGVVHLPGEQQYPVPAEWKPALDRHGNGEVILGFRPEAGYVSPDGPIGSKVYASDLYGSYRMLHLELETDVIANVRAGRTDNYGIGETLHFDIESDLVRFFDPQTEAAISREVVQ
jgi:multiple sugar transport system ATP-binding protein